MKADFDYPEPYWDDISKDAKDFINKLLVVDPRKRLTAEGALHHPWLQGGGVPNKPLNIKSEMTKFQSQRKITSSQNIK